MKKINLIILFCLIICLCFCGCGEKHVDVVPAPDKIIIYKNGKLNEINKDNNKFSKIVNLLNERFDKAVLSEVLSKMNDESLSKLKKEELSMEFIYSKEQVFDYKQKSFKYKKLFFPLKIKSNLDEEDEFYYAEDDKYTFPLARLPRSEDLIDLLK